MIYEQPPGNPGAPYPGSSLGTLDGSANPSMAGIYTYTPASSLALSGDTSYFIVLVSGTAVANGAYEWSESDSGGTSPDGWNEASYFFLSQMSGIHWLNSYPGITQFAITATPVPEPSLSWLLFLGSGFLIYVSRRKFSRGIN